MPAWALDHPRDRRGRDRGARHGQTGDVSPGTVLGARKAGIVTREDQSGPERPISGPQGRASWNPPRASDANTRPFLIFVKEVLTHLGDSPAHGTATTLTWSGTPAGAAGSPAGVTQQSIGGKWKLAGSDARSLCFLFDRTNRSICAQD